MLEKDYRRVDSLTTGESYTRPVFITKMEEKVTLGGKGKPYVSFTISDSECTITANKFQMKDGRPITVSLLESFGITENSIVMMELTKNEKGFVNVEGLGPNTDPEVSLEDFAQKAEGSAEDRYNRILSILCGLSKERKLLLGNENPTISDLGIALYKEYEESLKWSAAAEIMHSEKAGGLMEHTEAMVRISVGLCSVYPDLDKELLVTAAALHDIGKVIELNTSPLGRAEYTPEGVALGHIVIGYTLVDRLVHSNPGVYPKERVLLQESLILSHHEIKEYGSPVEPIVKELCLLMK